MATTTKKGFSFTDLHSATGRPTDGEVARRIGRSRRTIQRWKAKDLVPEREADALAIAFQMHPANVWPDQW